MGHSEPRRELPVFPFTDGQVEHVTDALDHALSHPADPQELARVALKALAQVLRMETERDPNGYPAGYGYRAVRGCTDSFVVHPDGTWGA